MKRVFSLLKFDSQRYLFIVTITTKHLTLVQKSKDFMSLEIERKFLVKNESFKNESHSKKQIKQGYLNSDKSRTVRIRIAADKAFFKQDFETAKTKYEEALSIDATKSEPKDKLELMAKAILKKEEADRLKKEEEERAAAEEKAKAEAEAAAKKTEEERLAKEKAEAEAAAAKKQEEEAKAEAEAAAKKAEEERLAKAKAEEAKETKSKDKEEK